MRYLAGFMERLFRGENRRLGRDSPGAATCPTPRAREGFKAFYGPLPRTPSRRTGPQHRFSFSRAYLHSWKRGASQNPPQRGHCRGALDTMAVKPHSQNTWHDLGRSIISTSHMANTPLGSLPSPFLVHLIGTPMIQLKRPVYAAHTREKGAGLIPGQREPILSALYPGYNPFRGSLWCSMDKYWS